jgi:hypothetical protein
MSKLMRLILVATLVAVPAIGAAQTGPNDEEHRGPSSEAIAACKDKSDGNACEFDGALGHVSGNCRKARSGDLACMHPHHHHDGGPSSGLQRASFDPQE